MPNCGGYHEDETRAPGGPTEVLLAHQIAEAEVAHAKMLVESPGRVLKLSLAGSRMERDEGPGTGTAGPARITLNVRARCSPERIVASVDELIRERRPTGYRYEALVPAPPAPTYRIEKQLER